MVNWGLFENRVVNALIRTHTILNTTLSTALIDSEVCAIDDEWSGLKLVYRLKYR
jgi:hypothetical protein